MEPTIEKFERLHQAVRKLEPILKEVWTCIDEIGEDEVFSNLMEKARQYQSKRMQSDESMEEFCERLDEFEKYMGDFPENGTAGVYFDEAITLLMEWFKENK
jgi:hypothetical protein